MNSPIQLSSRLVALAPGLYLVQPKPHGEFPVGLKIGLYPSPVGEGVLSFMQGGPAQPVAFLQRTGERVIAHVARGNATLLIVDYKRSDCVLNEPVGLLIQKLDPATLPAQPPVDAKETQKNQKLKSGQGFLPVQGALVGGQPFAAPKGIVGSPVATDEIAMFAIDGQQLPPGVELAYACKKAGCAEASIATAGKMVGSEQPDFPITMVCFLANQSPESEYEIKGHVVFAGSPPSAVVSGIELSGPTGREALVALRVAFIKRADQRGAPPKTSVWNDPAVLKRKAPGPQKGRKALKE